jgi:hypothetical protein
MPFHRISACGNDNLLKTSSTYARESIPTVQYVAEYLVLLLRTEHKRPRIIAQLKTKVKVTDFTEYKWTIHLHVNTPPEVTKSKHFKQKSFNALRHLLFS